MMISEKELNKRLFMPRKNIQEKRRRQILEALHKRLLIKPFDTTSIKEIADEAGLNHGMLHYYFKSKEEILLAYIDYSIDIYRTLFVDWLKMNSEKFADKEEFLLATLNFMTEKITLNRDLSRIFIEIWEIGNYNKKVKDKLREAYREWISTVAVFIMDQIGGPQMARSLSIAIVAISEGLSLLSVIFDDDDIHFGNLIEIFRNLFVSTRFFQPDRPIKSNP